MRTCHAGGALGTALSPFSSLAHVDTSRYSTAEHCLERRGQGLVSYPACETPDSFPCKQQAVLVVLYLSISWSRICNPGFIALKVIGFTIQLFTITFSPKEYSAPCNTELPQCKMISYQHGSFMLTRKYGNAQIFVGRKDICTEVLWMSYPIDKLNNNNKKSKPPTFYLLLRIRYQTPSSSRKFVAVTSEQR